MPETAEVKSKKRPRKTCSKCKQQIGSRAFPKEGNNLKFCPKCEQVLNHEICPDCGKIDPIYEGTIFAASLSWTNSPIPVEPCRNCKAKQLEFQKLEAQKSGEVKKVDKKNVSVEVKPDDVSQVFSKNLFKRGFYFTDGHRPAVAGRP